MNVFSLKVYIYNILLLITSNLLCLSNTLRVGWGSPGASAPSHKLESQPCHSIVTWNYRITKRVQKYSSDAINTFRIVLKSWFWSIRANFIAFKNVLSVPGGCPVTLFFYYIQGSPRTANVKKSELRLCQV